MIPQVNEKRLLRRIGNLRWTGQLLIVLALSSLGCARGDWTTETLTLVDVTGTWEGPLYFGPVGTLGHERTIRFVLQQHGSKVSGEVQGPDGAPIGSVEGLVKGEVLTWRATGPLMKLPQGGPSIKSYSGETTVNSDEMSGRADGYYCPCTFVLHRVNTNSIREKQAK